MGLYRILVVLHLLGASIWLGGHLVLSLVVLPRALRARDSSVVTQFESRYERIGIPALLVQVLTGLWLALRWVPDIGLWFPPATPQARWIVVKLALLALTAALAVHARLRIIPKLDADRLPALAVHVAGVTVLAIAFLVVGVVIRTGGTL